AAADGALQPIKAPEAAAGEKGKLPLPELKAATVYIKTETPGIGRATGSGFVVRAVGNTVHVATNHHVIAALTPDELPPARRPGRGRPGFMPRQMGPVELTAVFRSGTPQEQPLKAVVVADDPQADLAVLKVTGVRDAPRPIDCNRAPKLEERLPVVAFGFPFGADLDPDKANPSITVTNGSVSRLILNKRTGEVNEVQIQGEVNPGNSGGPLVDESGALVGVVVAKIDGTGTAFAIPVAKLNRLMDGRVTLLDKLDAAPGGACTEVTAEVNDPVGRLSKLAVLYGPANEVRMPARHDGGWDALAGAKSSELKVEGTKGVAVLALEPPEKGELRVVVQPTFVDAAGKTVYGEPKELRLAARGGQAVAGGPANRPPANPPAFNPPPANPAQPPLPVRGPASGEELTKLLRDLKSMDAADRQLAAEVLAQAPPRERKKEVAAAVRGVLGDAEPNTRTAAAKVLAAVDPKEAAPDLANLVADPDAGVRGAVLKLLRELKDPRAAEAVAAKLPTEPLAVLDILKGMGPGAERAVLPYLDDKYAGPTRFWAFNVLGEIGTGASLPALQRIPEPDALLARGVIAAVSERVPLGKEEWARALEDLRSPDANLRRKAARRIAATPPVEERRADVVSRLEGVLNDQSNEARVAAVKGLASWGGKKAIPTLAARLQGFDPGMHAVIIEALAGFKDDESAAAIAKRLPDAFDRGKAAEMLRAMDPTMAEKAILPLLKETNVFIRVEAVKVLGDVGGKDSVAPLGQLVADNNIFYSGPAAEALLAVKARTEAK
ncbi:MAG TPA: HEAT repeat domain-containing protein, partial [Gemmataceae bacterium]|nr:HEAT repeat domain-containing protein [Gemmataceae bacterium]